jgi:nitrite reductase/ring-hydroxylating ferredoxin subunit
VFFLLSVVTVVPILAVLLMKCSVAEKALISVRNEYWHGREFDIRTGQSYCDPEQIRTKAYPVAAEPGSSVIAGPYVAETVPVSVEENYIDVDI